MTRSLPVYRVCAVNTAPDSENKMHDDGVAAQYGFRGGLVPGVTVYGYMTVPVIEYAPEWLKHGCMHVRLVQPFYDGDPVIVRAELDDEATIRVTAEREDGTACGIGTARVKSGPNPPPDLFPATPLPHARPSASPDNLIPGAFLGSLTARLDQAEPARLLTLSNELLMQNFKLEPWIHVSSEITNWSAGAVGDEISVRGRIYDRFDKKGHEFVVLDSMLVANGARLVQTVRHTAIYRL